jgi:hypothetical protein
MSKYSQKLKEMFKNSVSLAKNSVFMIEGGKREIEILFLIFPGV